MKFALIFLFTLFPSFAFSQEPATSQPILAANSYVLYDCTSEQFLVQQNADTHIPPAHLTKLMTAYVVFGAIKQGKISLTQRLIPSAYATRMQTEESRMFLNAGKEVTVEELLRGLIVQSANDAARVLAETLANHEMALADVMNSEAQRLGLKDTHFVNATGTPDAQHYSSAHDLALIAAALVRDFPSSTTSTRSANTSTTASTSSTATACCGWTRSSMAWRRDNGDEEYYLVASAKRDDHRLISVVIGTATEKLRSSESQRLLNYGFQNFETIKLYSKEQSVSDKRIWKGTSKNLGIGFISDRYVTIPKGQRDALKATLETRQPMLAPYNRGQQIGTLHLTLNDKPYLDLPVVALDDIPLANVFSRGVDNIRLLFQ